MQKTYLSILSNDIGLLQSFKELLKDSKFDIGYIGRKNLELQNFIRSKTQDEHLLFLKPALNFMKVSSPENLKKLGQVSVIILGSSLPSELIGFLQEYKVAGYIKPSELNDLTINQIIYDVKKQGYSANYHIPKEFWVNKPKHVFPRPKPKLTLGEEQVLTLLCHNYNVKQISEELEKKEPAIRAHITNLRAKLHAQSLLEIVVITMANSWVFIDPNKTTGKSPFL
jgi:DNA-binding NarL/FixJ family response regulator